MYKYLIFIIYLFSFFMFFSCHKNDNFGELNFIDLRIQTVVNVSCEQLKKDYSTKKKNITKKESEKIFHIFSNLKKADADWETNARIFGFIRDESKQIYFCMGNNIITINGNNYFVTDNLRTYILEITDIH